MQEMNNENMADFLGVQAIAGILGLSRHVIYRLCQEGELPSYRFGGNIRVKTEDFENYTQKCRRGGTETAS
jgi:excisionase family DNA binding protein